MDTDCPFTKLPCNNVLYSGDFWYREVTIEHNQLRRPIVYKISDDLWDHLVIYKRELRGYHIISGMILNRRISSQTVLDLWDDDDDDKEGRTNVNEIIDNWSYPRTPKEKLDNLLQSIYNLQPYDGFEFSSIDLNLKVLDSGTFYENYFATRAEAKYYYDNLIDKGLLAVRQNKLSVSYDGLNYLIKLGEEQKETGTRCFIAMAFKPETQTIRTAIFGALKKTGFEPTIIDMAHIEPHQTINDAIIAEVRKSKFIIADFTHQRAGVYFEAGFAVGLGKKVIYTCKKSDFDNSHFDTNHFQHIVYENEQDLEARLVDKIEAWVKV